MKVGFIILFTFSSYAKEKIGLLIIAHGAPNEQWNRPVLNLEKEVKELISQKRQNIVFSNKGLLPDKRVSKWIVSRALEWVEENRSEFEVTH